MSTDKSIGEQNYEQFADRYASKIETKAHNAYYDRPATLSLLPDVNGLRVLDAGCGPGIYTEWLVEHGALVVAIDVTPRMVELTRQRVGSRAEVLQADLTRSLDFASDASFDLIICPLVLDNIEDWQPTFAEFYRTLKPGGIFVFSCGHPLGDYLFTTRRKLTAGNYFITELFEVPWRGFGEPYPVLKGYRRPLSAILNPLLKCGFALDTLLEPRPTEDFKRAEPEDYERLSHEPGFLCVRAGKPMSGV
jgi:SAM-dependent methyltransferase